MILHKSIVHYPSVVNIGSMYRLRPWLLRLLIIVIFISALICVVAPSAVDDSGLGWRPGEIPSGTGEAWDQIVDPRPLIRELEEGNTFFDWSTWLDLRKTELFDSGVLDPKYYPRTYNKRLGQLDFPIKGRATQHEQAMIGRLYSKHRLPAPQRVVALGDPRDHQATASIWNVTHESSKLRHRQYGHKRPTPPRAISPPLVPALDPKNTNVTERMRPEVPKKLFYWIPEAIPYRLGLDHPHSITVKKALDDAEESSKHFYEVALTADPMAYGIHYDWRFFRGVRDYTDHVAALHAMARTWQLFADSQGFAWWYAHGPLIGWHWNGFSLPWDPDLDIQMPVAEFDRIASDYNRTLVVQPALEGNRKYLLDIGPWYVDRVDHNGQNVIDGRFIDVDTGVYIDITALAFLGGSEPMAMCKANHRYFHGDISPLRRSAFEGSPAYVPNATMRVLKAEYRRVEQPNYGRWHFNKKIQLWEIDMTCEQMLAKFHTSSRVYCFPREPLPVDKCDGDRYQTCDRFAIEEYHRTVNVTSAHKLEAALWKKQPEPLANLSQIVNTYHPPFH